MNKANQVLKHKISSCPCEKTFKVWNYLNLEKKWLIKGKWW